MAEYKVAWEIDIEADSPRKAAEIAFQIMHDTQTDYDSACFFAVKDKATGASCLVDLADEE